MGYFTLSVSIEKEATFDIYLSSILILVSLSSWLYLMFQSNINSTTKSLLHALMFFPFNILVLMLIGVVFLIGSLIEFNKYIHKNHITES